MSTDLITKARAAIGESQLDDYILAPSRHAKEFESQAPQLSAILRQSEIGIIAEKYEEKDQDALERQVDFRRAFNRSNYAVLTTAILMAALLAAGVLAPTNQLFVIVLGAASVVSGGLAALYLNVIKQGDLFKAMMDARTLAEEKRLAYFAAVSATSNGGATDALTALFKLEYFRRFQLDLQRVYYRAAAKRRRNLAKRSLFFSSLAIAAAPVVTGVTSYFRFISPKFAALSALGQAITAVSSFIAVSEGVDQNRRLAEVYGSARDSLDDFAAKMDRVRQAVFDLGDPPLIEFVNAVQDQLRLEHQQWRDKSNQAAGAVEKLEQSLQNLRAAQKGSKTGSGAGTATHEP